MSSPDTISGSLSKDLNLSKLWLCQKLKKYNLVSFDNVYILGSWYGTMGLFLLSRGIKFNQLYNIDWSNSKTQVCDHIIKRMHLGNLMQAKCMDANRVEYSGDRILVINTSTNNIEGRLWYETIPRGSCIVVQGRNRQDQSNGIDTLTAFDFEYNFPQDVYLGKLLLRDAEGFKYHRFMKIGIK